MPSYEIKLKDVVLEGLRGARQRVLDRLGKAKIADALTRLDEARAGALANDLLALLDAVDQVVAKAKRVD